VTEGLSLKCRPHQPSHPSLPFLQSFHRHALNWRRHNHDKRHETHHRRDRRDGDPEATVLQLRQRSGCCGGWRTCPDLPVGAWSQHTDDDVQFAIYNVAGVVYNLFFHPLHRFPGPLLNRASRIPHALSKYRGNVATDALALHRQYGDVVRFGPDQLSFTDPAAWKDIYGHRPGRGEHEELPKNVTFEKILPSVPKSILSAGTDQHAVLRKGFAPSFSEKGIRNQEHLIQQYVSLLIKGIAKHSTNAAGKAQAVNMTAWFNWITFDIIGELLFAEPWGCLENASWHPWVIALLVSIKQVTTMEALLLAGAGILALVVVLPGARAHIAHQKISMLKLKKRMELGSPRDDLAQVMLDNQDNWVSISLRRHSKAGSKLIQCRN